MQTNTLLSQSMSTVLLSWFHIEDPFIRHRDRDSLGSLYHDSDEILQKLEYTSEMTP